MVYLAAAFSLSMLTVEGEVKVTIQNLTGRAVKRNLKNGFISAVGHSSTAELLTAKLGLLVPSERLNVSLKKDDVLIVAQLKERLNEGEVLTLEQLEKKEVTYLKVTL